jgi:hypothetical protein
MAKTMVLVILYVVITLGALIFGYFMNIHPDIVPSEWVSLLQTILISVAAAAFWLMMRGVRSLPFMRAR